MDPLFLVLSGFVVGALVGLTGVGGGSLMTPLLIGTRARSALCVSLAAAGLKVLA